VNCEESLMRISAKLIVAVLAAALVAGGAFLLGRETAPNTATKHSGDYFAGLRAGEAQGREEGRALQAGSELPANAKDVARRAFDAGFVAGANDVFEGYDGGWQTTLPWVVTLDAGTGKVVYRIASRDQMQPGVNYYLCADGRSLCQQPRK